MTDSPENPNPEARFSPEVEAVLREAGWYPGREVDWEQLGEWAFIEAPVEKGFLQVRMFSAALYVLREFGGLTIKSMREGGTSIEGFTINPPRVFEKSIWHYNWYAGEWMAKGALYPLGYIHDDHWVFGVRGDGRIVTDDHDLVGNNIDEALENLIKGIKPTPIEMTKEMAEIYGEANYLFSCWAHNLHEGNCLNRTKQKEE